jgi:hypothetical protein
MNPDTVRTLNEIKKNGWYRLSTGMGDGGWRAVMKLGVFKTYVLDAIQCQSWEEIEVIRALNDEKAFVAFSKLYHLEMFDEWEIRERIIKFRLVKSSEEN